MNGDVISLGASIQKVFGTPSPQDQHISTLKLITVIAHVTESRLQVENAVPIKLLMLEPVL